jgi:hypothetical protein
VDLDSVVPVVEALAVVDPAGVPVVEAAASVVVPAVVPVVEAVVPVEVAAASAVAPDPVVLHRQVVVCVEAPVAVVAHRSAGRGVGVAIWKSSSRRSSRHTPHRARPFPTLR